MTVRLLSTEQYPEIKDIKAKFEETRVVSVSDTLKLNMVEIFNKCGKFRGFGHSTEKAYKNAIKAFKKRTKHLQH
jgi:hypothetical protein